MFLKTVRLVLALLIPFVFVACGGDSDDYFITQTGTLNDSKVAGVSYSCGSNSGLTTGDGEFSCRSDSDNFKFSIGSVTLGSIKTANLKDFTVYPADLVGSDRTDTNSSKVTNILQILQSLDSDGNPNNGIVITKATREALAKVATLRLDSNNTTKDDLNATVLKVGRELIKADYAVAHYEDTLRYEINSTVDTVPPAPAKLLSTLIVTNKDLYPIKIMGERKVKTLIDGNYTGINTDMNYTATIKLNLTGKEDGNVSFMVALQDNLNQTSDELNVTILRDTIAPDKATISSYSEYTNQDKVSVTLYGEENATVLIGTQNMGRTYQGALQVDLNTSGVDGVKNFDIYLRDLATNRSEPLTVSMIKDTVPPEKAKVKGKIPSHVNYDAVTTTIYGEEGAKVYINGVYIGTIKNGSLEVTFDTSGVDGVRNFSVILRDIAGNDSDALIFTITKDTVPPLKPSLVTKAGLVNKKLNAFVIGEANTNAYVNGTSYGLITSNGQLNVHVPNPNNAYFEILSVKLIDLAGNESDSITFKTVFSRASIDQNFTYYIPEHLNLLKESSSEKISIVDYEDNQTMAGAVANISFSGSQSVSDRLNSIVNSINGLSNVSMSQITEQQLQSKEGVLAEYSLNYGSDIGTVDLISILANSVMGKSLSNLPTSNASAIVSNRFNILFKLVKKSSESAYLLMSVIPNSLSLDYQTTVTSTTNSQNLLESNATIYKHTDSFVSGNSGNRNMADFLFVIDDSGSMSSYQNAVSQASKDFADAVTSTGIDFRIGIITTSDSIDGSSSNYYYNSSASRVLNDVGIIENNIELFKQKVVVGTYGSSTETGIYNAERALQSKALGDSSDGILTTLGMPSDKLLSIIMLSDEPSQYSSRAGYGSNFNVDNNLFIDRGYTVYSIVHSSVASYSQYDDLATKTGGLIADITNTSSYSTIMNTIAQKSVATTGYKQTKSNAIEATMNITINGTEIPHGNINGWRYMEEYNTVLFYGTAIPEQGDKISVNYSYIQ